MRMVHLHLRDAALTIVSQRNPNLTAELEDGPRGVRVVFYQKETTAPFRKRPVESGVIDEPMHLVIEHVHRVLQGM